MNAIIGLCHFCEAHGPRALFCTFTTDDENHTKEASNSSVDCTGCTSLGPETILVSRDEDGTIFCSRESVLNADVTAFLRQAAIRSITCEVSFSIYFCVYDLNNKFDIIISSSYAPLLPLKNSCNGYF